MLGEPRHQEVTVDWEEETINRVRSQAESNSQKCVIMKVYGPLRCQTLKLTDSICCKNNSFYLNYLKYDAHLNNIEINSNKIKFVPNKASSLNISIWLMLLRKMIAVYCETHMERTKK